ncbi:MAG: radical SAM family heme chaperone HemW [Blastochloris sp.]|nr:radical SAM family heme chaperone HemW [Blastochloris sp.]
MSETSRPVIRHLYVHVPFCTHICPYCAFYKMRNTLPEMKSFLPALKQELAWAQKQFDLQLETVFFGGGTPSALSVSQLEFLFEGWSLQEVAEVTMEANPMTISTDKAKLLKDLGFNRVSLGVQAFDEASLRLLGRTHDAAQVEKSMGLLREAGFENINVDLMFALPGQSLEQWQGSLRAALALSPEHISAYNLNYEEDTAFFERLESGLLRIDPEQERTFYLWADECLTEAGFEHYEISNYARPGWAARHNQAIWDGADYLGLGPSACSTLGSLRWKNTPDLGRYAEVLEETGEPPRELEPLSAEMRQRERILLSLRTQRGCDVAGLGGREAQIEQLVMEGLVEREPGRIRLTRQGQLVADTVTEYLL